MPRIEPLADAPDPVEACARLLDLPFPILLDSAAGDLSASRFTYLTADPWRIVRAAPNAPPAAALLDDVRDALAPFRTESVPGMPPFQGGAAGFLAYDFGSALERLPAPRWDDIATPALLFGLYDWVVAWDRASGEAWIVSTGMPLHGAAAERRAAERLAGVRERLGRAASFERWRPTASAACDGPPRHAVPDVAERGATRGSALRSTFTRAAYEAAVARVREYVLAGDVFQVNLSQRFEAPLAEPPLAFWQRLRAGSPAPFGAFLACGDFAVASISPERFLRVDPDGTVETRPIKGTRPRGGTPAGDAALADELQRSEKDRAENVMIVDLLRNDLSRVCAPGTVRVPSLLALETHPTVHHLVSTVTGRLEPPADAFDLLRAAFPGGSITGAPKVRAMEIIAELEPTRRGVYCGAIGYVSVTGAMDTSIAIRTAVARRDRIWYQAGGGITAESDPAAEYDETLAKARAFVAAVGEAPP